MTRDPRPVVPSYQKTAKAGRPSSVLNFPRILTFAIQTFRMKPSLLNALLLGLSHAEDDSNDVVNFKIESCNAADKEVPFIETFVQ